MSFHTAWPGVVAPMPTPRGYFGAAAVGKKIYAVGGNTRGKETSDVVEVFDTETGAWSPGPALPEPRWALAVAALDCTVYAAGGSPGGSRQQWRRR